MRVDDYEKLGLFYLGKKFDSGKQNTTDSLLMYDSKDMVTHGVCLGMTGSGKTGLCLVVLEEAIIDKIPIIIIDPKGDISNLLLTFPKLSSNDFLPWINEEDATKKGLTKDEFAQQQSELWKKGLEEWGQTTERISKLRNSANFIIYTPGSTSGIPISILDSFSIPSSEILNDNELLFERISNTVTGLLALIGINAKPIESREHILLSHILETNWKNGKNLTLEEVIQNVQTPSISKIGLLDLESFYPSKDRFNLVISLNNLLSSSSFSSWLHGVPMDIQNLLYDNNGKPNVSIFSISHLNDNERMFFVTLLLNQIISWMRTQPGTSTLRSILYMDEISGFLPPVKNPPSKAPFLTLLKQARAFGLGLLLATQNPVDLDYKALSNIGTWFLGRLQTQRDKLRLLDGLEGTLLKTNNTYDRTEMDKIISGLENRVFLMNNIHEDKPVLFQTRWAMSYLRGPITRNQIKLLMDPIRFSDSTVFFKKQGEKIDVVSSKQVSNNFEIKNSNDNLQTKEIFNDPQRSNKFEYEKKNTNVSIQPVLNPDISQYYIPLSCVKTPYSSINDLIYFPILYAFVSINFKDSKSDINVIQDHSYFTPLNDSPVPVDWNNIYDAPFSIKQLEKTSSMQNFLNLPLIATKKETYENWKKDLIKRLTTTEKLIIYKNVTLNSFSKPNESERDFKIRSQICLREHRNNLVGKLRTKYSPRFNNLKKKIEKAQKTVNIQKEQAEIQKMNTAISFGTNLLGAFLGRNTSRNRIKDSSKIIKDIRTTVKEQKDVSKARNSVESLYAQYSKLENEFQNEMLEIELIIKNAESSIISIEIKPLRKDISVQLFSLAWMPLLKNQIVFK